MAVPDNRTTEVVTVAAAATETTTSPLVGLVSGCAGAVSLVYVGQPLDTVKVRMQLWTATRATAASGSLSMWDCVRDMWRQALYVAPPTAGRRPLNNATVGAESSCPLTAGQRANKTTAAVRMARLMYAGTAPALLANVAENGVLFAAYGPCQRLVSCILDVFGTGVADPMDRKLCPMAMATAGSLASFFSAFALCPTELIKVRLQAADLESFNTRGPEKAAATTKRRGRAGTLQVVANVWTTEGGLRGMYRGMGSTIAREMPGYYVFFLAYEACRNRLNGWYRGTARNGGDDRNITGNGHGPSSAANRDEPAWVTMIAGAAAGACLWLVVYPVDAVKSRIQATCGTGENLGGSFLKTLAVSVRTEGPLALYRGLSPTLLRTVPASAIMFLTVERVTILLSGYGL